MTTPIALLSLEHEPEHQKVNSTEKKSNEFKRHRQVLLIAYATLATLGFSLMGVSVVKQLFFRKAMATLPNSLTISVAPTPQELLECHNLVLEQLTSLTTKTTELLERPQNSVHAEKETRSKWRSDWKEFSTQWRDQWDRIDARCSFSELAFTNLGPIYNQLAEVHEALPAMRLKYNRILADFDKEQADELTQMMRALRDSNTVIRQQLKKVESP